MKWGQGWGRISGLLIPSPQMLRLCHTYSCLRALFSLEGCVDGDEPGLGTLLSLGMGRGRNELGSVEAIDVQGKCPGCHSAVPICRESFLSDSRLVTEK